MYVDMFVPNSSILIRMYVLIKMYSNEADVHNYLQKASKSIAV